MPNEGTAAPTAADTTKRTLDTLVVRLSAPQKASLKRLQQIVRAPSEAEVMQRALAAYARTNGVVWPAKPDGRRKATAKPKAPPPPVLKARSPDDALRAWVSRVEAHHKEMTPERWRFMRATAKAAVAAMPDRFTRWWTLMDTHREAIATGKLDGIPERDGPYYLRTILRAMYLYESIRDEWSAWWRREYGGVDRAKLSSAALDRLRERDADRQRRHRAKKRPSPELIEAFTAEPDAEVTTGELRPEELRLLEEVSSVAS